MIAGPGSRWRIRWRLASPPLRLLAQAVVAALAAVGGFAFLNISDKIDETAASVLVAVVFGVATVLQLRQAQRRQHTVDLLTNFQSTDSLFAADMWMAERIASHRQIEVDVASEDARHVMAILDYYEFLSSLAIRGLVDTPLLLATRGGTMTRCLDICQAYIADRRAEVGDELYWSFEVFVEEHSRRNPSRRTPAAPQHSQDAG